MKLFKKLQEQVEINACKSNTINEEEKKDIENKIIYEDFVKRISDEVELASK